MRTDALPLAAPESTAARAPPAAIEGSAIDPTWIDDGEVRLASARLARGARIELSGGLDGVLLAMPAAGALGRLTVVLGKAGPNGVAGAPPTPCASWGPGQGLLLADGQPCRIEVTDATLPMHRLYIEPAWLAGLAALVCGHQPPGWTLPTRLRLDDPVLRHVAARYVQAVSGEDAGSLFTACLRHLLGVSLVIRHGSSLPARRFRARPLPLASLRLVADHIDANLAGAVSVEQLARIARLSEHHFMRSFGLATGMTPYQFVLRQRLERAKRLLRDTPIPIAQVALEAGFANQSHLTQTFRRLFASTPAEYRVQCR